MAMEWKLALPLHPEYRTLPMVWYVPPLSPIQSAADAGELGSNGILPDVESLRIPVQYLANLLTAGDQTGTARAETYAGDASLQTLKPLTVKPIPCAGRGRSDQPGTGDVSLSGYCQLRRSLCGTEQSS